MSFDSESGGHWYYTDGRPCYEINGRPTTLRDARKLSLVKSVTTHLNVIAKPALTNWLVDQGIMAALTMPRNPGEDEATYIKRIKEDSKAEALASAQLGSKIHDACEQLVKTGSCPDEFRLHADAAVAELRRLFPGVNDWIAEQPFAHPSGYGGKVDLHSPSTGIIADYKTKPGDFTDGKRLHYDQHWQLAAYQDGLLLPRAPGAAIFVSRTHPGAVASHVWTAEEMEEGSQVFKLALALSQRLSGYSGAF